MLLEDKERNTLIGECQIIVLSFLLVTKSESWEDFTKWNVGSQCSVCNVHMKEQIVELIERQPTISTSRFAAQVDFATIS
jgi:hypothetical protein